MSLDYAVLCSRWLHFAAAIVAVGGAIFMRFVLLPGANESLSSDSHEALRESIRRRWSRILMACIALLLLTGGLNFVMLALPPKIKPMPYHAIFGVKLLAALFIFFIASALAGRSPGLAAMRAARKKWLGILIITAGFVILLSGVLSQVRVQSSVGSG